MKIKNLQKYKYIDICCNASLSDIKDVILSAVSSDVLPLVVAGDPEGNITANQLHGIPVTFGVHPHASRRVTPEYFSDVDLTTIGDNCVAIGECGLDYDHMYSPRDIQLEIFESQLDLAKRTGLPLLLHERAAMSDFLSVVRKHGYMKGVVHCFTGNRDTVLKYLSLDFYIGITGWITQDWRNSDLLEAVKYIPLERLMVETDSPYLLPKGYDLKGKNRPENVAYVVKKLSAVLDIDEEKLRKQVFENTCRLFGIEEKDKNE